MQANEKTIIGVDHGYAAIKTTHCVFPTGLTAYNHEPYTRQDVLEYEGKWYVCGTGRQPVQREKMANDTYYAGSHRQGAGKAASAAQMYRGFGVRPAFDELRTAKGQL